MDEGHEDVDSKLKEARQRLSVLDADRAALLQLISTLEEQSNTTADGHSTLTGQTINSPAIVRSHMHEAEKIKLFRSIFRGRDDVYALRFESKRTGRSGYSPACRHEWVRGICHKPQIKCGDCDRRELLPLTDDVIRAHLIGRDRGNRTRSFVVGIYPLLPDETCWFLAADFDKEAWQEDAMAFVASCREQGVSTALERSRSGNGAHVWIPFEGPLSAALARRLGAALLTLTMERRPEVGLDSYDRFFPNQDTMPEGQFGNLIALPFQGSSIGSGNTVFLDDELQAIPDQWAFLSSLGRTSEGVAREIVEQASADGKVFGVRLPVADEHEDDPWTTPPSRRPRQRHVEGSLPVSLRAVLGNEIYVEKAGLPPALRNKIIRIAAFLNPDFYSKQAMRKSTYDTPRIIGCAEDHMKFIGLPIGCLDDLKQLCGDLGIDLHVNDERNAGVKIDASFLGTLRPEQSAAVKQLISHDNGVLAASTAFGKTVVAIDMIARRATNTLILVHRKQLMDQWIERLVSFLGLDRKSIGHIGGGKRKPTGIVDVALIQSLCRKGVVDDVVAEYGHLIVDECHRIAAPSFEQVARRCRARYVLGLSATVKRKDGHHPIIFMQCGPIRFRTDPRKDAAERPFEHHVRVRVTNIRMPGEENMPIHGVYKHLLESDERNRLIVDDVCEAVAQGRSPVILTERKEHIQRLAEAISGRVTNVVVMTGGMGVRQRRTIAEQLAAISENDERVIIATGKYLGEGFDDARLDTLFLALPISWRGTLAQYAGRLHRDHDMKRKVVIYDYSDTSIPVLEKMLQRRLRGYAAIGYRVVTPGEQELSLI